MKLKTFVLTVALALAASAVAVAAPPAGKGKPSTPAAAKGKPATTGDNCKPRVAVVLKGTLAATDGSTSITVDVKRTNHHGKVWKDLGVAIALDAKTKIVRNGRSSAASLVVADVVVVHARVCKADLPNGGTPALTAKKVIARAPAAS